MTLLQYIRDPSHNATSLAGAVGIATAFLYQIAHGKRSASAALARSIEEATGGAVMRWDLRPDWRAIWPELAQRADAPKHAA